MQTLHFKTLHAQNLLNNHESRNINLANIYLTIETLEKGNIQMLKNNFYKVVVQKWFLNGVIKNRCQLLVDLVVNWMTFHYERKHMLSQATGMLQNLLSCWEFFML